MEKSVTTPMSSLVPAFPGSERHDCRTAISGHLPESIGTRPRTVRGRNRDRRDRARSAARRAATRGGGRPRTRHISVHNIGPDVAGGGALRPVSRRKVITSLTGRPSCPPPRAFGGNQRGWAGSAEPSIENESSVISSVGGGAPWHWAFCAARVARNVLPCIAAHDQSWRSARNYFDVWVAKHYEVLWAHLFDPQVVDPAVDFLTDLAGDGRALELGIGTGRLALPLSRRGVRVDGIELSPAMVEQLRSQPGSTDIDVTIGDFSTTKVNGTFTLVYLVRNTIMNLTTQDAQLECFLNVERCLEPGGRFVIEVIVPPWQRLPPGETVIPFDVSPTHLGFDEIDVATQTSWSHHYWFVDGETKSFSAPFRNVWPSELDLMARLAGMALRNRWSDWRREPFTSTSRSHISVWQKPE